VKGFKKGNRNGKKGGTGKEGGGETPPGQSGKKGNHGKSIKETAGVTFCNFVFKDLTGGKKTMAASN